MKRFVGWMATRPRDVVAGWLLVLCVSAIFASRLDGVIRASMDGIPGSPSDRVMQTITRTFGPDAAFVFPVVVENPALPARAPAFRNAIAQLEERLLQSGDVGQVRHHWNAEAPGLLGRDGHSALLLVRPRASTFYEAELLVGRIREHVRAANLAPTFIVMVTGPVAVFHDMNRDSAEDLLKAERIGIPVTLCILLVVFGAPLAAGLPVLLAAVAVLASLACLWVLSFWMPVSVFARNAVTMIGLGVGVDYALFVLRRFREELRTGAAPREAAVHATALCSSAVVFSGTTVAVGFLALLLVPIPMMHSLAIAGAMVVLVAVLATVSLLPAMLVMAGRKIYWPRRIDSTHYNHAPAPWRAWAERIMRRPWLALTIALSVTTALAAPVTLMRPWNPGANDLPWGAEARRGARALQANFAAGWLGPVAITVQAQPAATLWDPDALAAASAIKQRLERDRRIAYVATTPDSIDATGTIATMMVVPRHAPESREAMALVAELRVDAWPEARAARLAIGIGGASAGIADFDQSLFDSLWRVIPAVLLVTFGLLVAMLGSVLVPLKASLLNLLSVLASWGFLVLVFQLGLGSELTGLQPPGGLNAFIVLMLFTILFGLSMDYELFLLSRIKEERDRGATNAMAVANALERTGGTITSAALVMVCIFGSFALTELTTTRMFGVGLAFAVAFDATLIRLVMVPSLMRLMGDWNWWLPGRARSAQGIETRGVSHVEK